MESFVYPFSKWEQIFKDPMTTAAAIDRLVHHSVILELNLPSYRIQAAKKGKFGLRLHPTKTKHVCFDRRNVRSGTFDFLGFTFYYGKSRKGNRVVKLKTCKERLRSKLKQFKEWVKANRNCLRLPELWETAKLKLTGHINYYGVSWNSRSLTWFCWNCTRLLFKWLNRRSQKRSYNWNGFRQRLQQFPLPRPRIRVTLFAVPACG